MGFSWKTTAVGVGLTAGALMLLHNNFEAEAEQREATYAALIACSEELGRIGCAELMQTAEVEPQGQSAENSSIIFTYDPQDIADRANEIRGDDEQGFQYFIYPTTLITGLGLTFAMQNPKTRAALVRQ